MITSPTTGRSTSRHPVRRSWPTAWCGCSTCSGQLHALDAKTGEDVFNTDVGDVTHFSAPSAGNKTVFVEGGKTVQAFTSASSDTPSP